MYNSLDTPVSAQTPGVARGACNSSAAGLASLVTGEVPQEFYARPVDGPPEMAPNCEALISKAKATERELIRTPVIHDRESQKGILFFKKSILRISQFHHSNARNHHNMVTVCMETTPSFHPKAEKMLTQSPFSELMSQIASVGYICMVSPTLVVCVTP